MNRIFSYARLGLVALFLGILLSNCSDKEDSTPEQDGLFRSYILQYMELTQEGITTRVEGHNTRLNLTNVSTFQQDNEPFGYDLNGSMPVNRYFGRYALVSGPVVPTDNPQVLTLSVRQVGSTEVAGSPAKMQFEVTYLLALKEVYLANLSKDGKLVLTSRYQNAKLVYVPAE